MFPVALSHVPSGWYWGQSTADSCTVTCASQGRTCNAASVTKMLAVNSAALMQATVPLALNTLPAGVPSCSGGFQDGAGWLSEPFLYTANNVCYSSDGLGATCDAVSTQQDPGVLSYRLCYCS